MQFTDQIIPQIHAYENMQAPYKKTLLKKRWFRAGLACLILTASAGAGYGQITLSINASNAVRTADVRWFGINVGDWDTDFNIQDTVPQLAHAGFQTLRFPGGSDADQYHWYLNITNNSNSYQGNNSCSSFAQVATNMGATVFITVNYGSGTADEAAAWVKWANVTNHYGFKYWEVGNECFGSYETDNHSRPHDPYTYATNFAGYMQQMKAADPTIKVGVVLDLEPDADSNGYTDHPATNLVTGQVLYGWTPVVLSTLRRLGVTPDYGILHRYAEYPPSIPENDQFLLYWGTNWAGHASLLRQQITQYFGSGGQNIELVMTENNANATLPQGKQSVSLVNGLYYADSLGQLMKTELNSMVWWQLRDGGAPDTGGNMSTNFYGWRMYGAFGMMWNENLGIPLTNRFPTYFAAGMISRFIGSHDTVLNASSDNALVSAYAALRTNGSLTLMAINKSSVSNCPVNITLTNYVPFSIATLYSYGISQDNAAKLGLNSLCDIAQTNVPGVSTNFSYVLAPYSINVFEFVPPAANTITPIFSGLTSHTVDYGASVTLTGTLGTSGAYPPSGTAITVTINGTPQTTTIYDSTGDFTINYNTAALPGIAGTYAVTYSSGIANGFNAATDTSTTLTITLASGVSPPGVVYWVGIFNSSADTAVWVTAEGLGTASFLGDAPPGGPSSGCLLFQAPYGSTNPTWQGIQNASLSLNVTNCTAFEMDVKIEGPLDRYGQISSLQPIMQTGAGLSWIPSTVQPKLVPQSANNGWQHISIPAASFDGGNIANWANVRRLLLTVYDGDYTNAQTMAIGFDNIKFTGPGISPVFSGLTSHTIAYGSTVTLTGRVGASGAYPASGTVVTLSINGSLQATTIYNSTGDFSINYNTAGLPTSATAYAVTYWSAAGAGFNGATDTSTTLTIVAPPQMGGISVNGTQFIFSYPTVAGQTYQLQYCTDLSSDAWLPAGSPVLGTGAPVWATNGIGSSMQMFFRLSITP